MGSPGEFTSDKFRHKGDYLDNKKHGYGEFVWATGAKYTGHFKNGKRDGYGEYVDEKGAVSKGRWVDGVLQD